MVSEVLLVPKLDPRTEGLMTCPRPLPAPEWGQTLRCIRGSRS